MKKVFIIHGFEGSPNGGWRPWLMAELEKKDIYACALSMPSPERPVVKEWVEEISRHATQNKKDSICLVGHSLGVPAILRFLETSPSKTKITSAILVSGPCKPTKYKKLKNFLEKPFNFKKIKSKVKNFTVIHGSNDPLVPIEEAEILKNALGAELVIIKNGSHLNGGSGWFSLPELLTAILKN